MEVFEYLTENENYMRDLLVICMLFISMTACSQVKNNNDNHMKEIYFAGGCFWGTEHFMKMIDGVDYAEVGYANGNTKNPTYQDVCTGKTGFAETVKVKYDPSKVDLGLLLDLYFKTIDPISLNKQGNDRGTQYRTGIYYTDDKDRPVIENFIKSVQSKYSSPVVVEVEPLRNFYKAENYHQDYLDKNPGGYCHISPELFYMAKNANKQKAYVKQDEKSLKEKLSPMQYAVTMENSTEPPFRNEYWDEKREGIYVDITTGEPLFVSTDKFDSGCGWPSFSKPIDNKLIEEKSDVSHGMVRTEVRSKTGDAHLGHVFNDGPKDKGGLRYCINSASLRFIPKDSLEVEGYGRYIRLFDKK